MAHGAYRPFLTCHYLSRSHAFFLYCCLDLGHADTCCRHILSYGANTNVPLVMSQLVRSM